MQSQIILQHIGIDTYLMMIKLQLRIETNEHAEEYLRFLGFTQDKKPSSTELGEWIESMKVSCLKHFETAYLAHEAKEEKPVVTANNVVETTVAPNGAVVNVVSVAKPEVIEEPKKKGRAKKATTETIETTATVTPIAEAKVVEAVSKPEGNLNQSAKVDEGSQSADLLTDDTVIETHDDIMFDRKDKVHLKPIMDKLTELDANWKANTELITKLKAVLDMANGKWIFIRDGVLNKGLFIDVIFAAKHDKGLPDPHFTAG